MPPLTQGYAEVVSDSGHQGDGMSAAFALNDTFAAQLFGSLSVPTVMSTALKILPAAYGVPPAKSYFEGCSNGGREALMAVQRNPNLFDGVIARSPGYNWVGFMGAFNRTAKALAAPGGAFSPAKTALLAKHVREACDGLDGIVDGVISNPAACTAKVVNITALRCAGGADTGDTCLSDAQLAVIKSWTTDAVFKGSNTFRSRAYNLTGNEDDPGGFGIWVSGDGNVKKAGQYMFQDTSVKYVLARDPNADSLKYIWDNNQSALYSMAALDDATQTDIRPFIQSGGKLIVWHGGSDSALSVNSTIEYMENVTKSVGAANASASTRLYVAPGVNHCEGGVGPDKTDLLTALDQWVTKGIAPGTLTAEKRDASGAVTRALPMCTRFLHCESWAPRRSCLKQTADKWRAIAQPNGSPPTVQRRPPSRCSKSCGDPAHIPFQSPRSIECKRRARRRCVLGGSGDSEINCFWCEGCLANGAENLERCL